MIVLPFNPWSSSGFPQWWQMPSAVIHLSKASNSSADCSTSLCTYSEKFSAPGQILPTCGLPIGQQSGLNNLVALTNLVHILLGTKAEVDHLLLLEPLWL